MFGVWGWLVDPVGADPGTAPPTSQLLALFRRLVLAPVHSHTVAPATDADVEINAEQRAVAVSQIFLEFMSFIRLGGCLFCTSGECATSGVQGPDGKNLPDNGRDHQFTQVVRILLGPDAAVKTFTAFFFFFCGHLCRFADAWVGELDKMLMRKNLQQTGQSCRLAWRSAMALDTSKQTSCQVSSG